MLIRPRFSLDSFEDFEGGVCECGEGGGFGSK